MTQSKYKVVVRHLGANDNEGKLFELKASGEYAASGEVLAIVETTKAAVEISAEVGGYFYPFATIGSNVFEGQSIGLISSDPIDNFDVDTEVERRPHGDIFITKAAEALINEYSIELDLTLEREVVDTEYLISKYPEFFLPPIPQCTNPELDLVVVGAGSAAELIFEHVSFIPDLSVRVFVDYNPVPHRKKIFGINVVGFGQLNELYQAGFRNVFVHLPSSRRTNALSIDLEAIGYHLANVVHPTAVISPYSQLGKNNLIGPNVIIGPFVTLGNSVSVLNGASVAHHSRIEEGARISDGARVAGNCVIGKYALLGLNSTVNARVQIADGMVVNSGKSVYENS